jgi:adenine phosphoribosyltransferase
MDLQSALSLIRPIADYPKPGIIFQDITPLLSNADAFSTVISEIASRDPLAEIAIGIEARGFILASAVAVKRDIGFVPIRKRGKLPAPTFSHTYGLEYGIDEIEIHRDAFLPGTKITLIDDVLATGGTLEAALRLISDAGGIVSSIVVLLEITTLKGRSKLNDIAPEVQVHSLVSI